MSIAPTSRNRNLCATVARKTAAGAHASGPLACQAHAPRPWNAHDATSLWASSRCASLRSHGLVECLLCRTRAGWMDGRFVVGMILTISNRALVPSQARPR